MATIFYFYFLISFATCAVVKYCPYKCRCQDKGREYMVSCSKLNYTTLPVNMTENVTFLHFASNRVQALTKQMFKKYSKLKHVILIQNRISEVSIDAFQGLTELHRLDLSGNFITYFPWKSLDSMPKLSILGLDYNRIENIPTKDETRKLKQLGILRIQDNNFICACQLYDFVQWMKNNSEVARRGKNYVKIPKQNILRCSSKMKWIDIAMSGIDDTEKLASTKCLLPRLEITAEIGKERESQLQAEQYFGVTEYQELRLIENKRALIICKVKKLERKTDRDHLVLKTAIRNGTENDSNYIWQDNSKKIFDQIKKETHDGMKVICAAENMAGTVTKQAIIKVTSDKEEGDEEEFTTTPRSLQKTNIFTEDFVTITQAFPTFRYVSMCDEQLSDKVLILNASFSPDGRLQYSYTFDKTINLTIKEENITQGIIVSVTSDETTRGSIFICHSHGSTVLKRQFTLRGGSETVIIRSASTIAPFIVCIKSTHFKTEVCGNFTVIKRHGENMIIMVIVGATLLSISTMPLIIAALHHITRNSLQAESKRLAITKLNLKDLPASFRIQEAERKESKTKLQKTDKNNGEDLKDGQVLVKMKSLSNEEFESSTTQENLLGTDRKWHENCEATNSNMEDTVARWLETITPVPAGQANYEFDGRNSSL